jgi:hypothetical protein
MSLLQPEAIILAISIAGLVKQVLFVVLAVLNGVLSIIATLAIWKSYLITGAKVLFTLLVLTPVVGLVVYMIWGQKKVRDAA